MCVSRRNGARAWLAALLIPVLTVSAFGQAAPADAQPPASTPPASRPTSQPAPAPPSGQPPAGPPTSIQPPASQTPVTPPATEAERVREQRTSGPTITLSMDETVKRALEYNLNVQVQRINPRLQDLAIQGAQSVWKPVLQNTTRYSDIANVPQNSLEGREFVTYSFVSNSSIAQALPWYGQEYTLSWNNDHVASSGSRSQSFNPSVSSNLSINFTQPLLRDFKIDNNRTQLLVQRKQREITDVQFQQTIIQTSRQVQNAYWDLVYARANLGVAQQSLDLARQTLRDNKTRVEVGTMAPIDIVRAEAEVARNEETAIIAAAQIDAFEDSLRRLIFDPQSPDYWTTNIDLTEQAPQPSGTDVDIEGAVAVALQQRTDLIQQRKSLESSDINIRYYKNQLLPQMDFFTTYGQFGRGGFTAGDPGDPDADPVVPPTPPSETSWADVLGNVFRRRTPQWTVGFQVQYPLGRSNQQVQLARARLQYQQSQLGLKDAELQAANEVRAAGRNVNTNRRRVEAARSSRVLSERQLEAEQKKFAVGLSSPFEVVQAQRDLANARDAELRAIISYVKSLVDFDASQKAGTGNTSAAGPTGTGGGGGGGNTGGGGQGGAR